MTSWDFPTGRRWVCMERDLDYSLGALDRIAKL